MTGIVLAGGGSRRLGRQKSLELVAGRTLLERALTALAQVTADIIIVIAPGQDRSSIPRYVPARIVEDVLPDRGPVAALYTGLVSAGSAYAWAVGCDMPSIDPGLLRYLMAEAPGYQAAVPVVGGRLQPLHAVYCRTALPALASLLGDPRAGLHRFLDRLRVRHVEETEAGGPGAWSRSCFNVNTERDLALAPLVAATIRGLPRPHRHSSAVSHRYRC